MKICERALNFIQIIDYKGTVRCCGWIKDNELGKLTESSFKEIYHGENAKRIRERLSKGDYSDCIVDACPYCAMGNHDKHMKEIDEIPEYPEELYLAYEEVCNYNCTSCTTPETMRRQRTENLQKGYDTIEKQLEDVLPHVKLLGANGRGEVFASKHILKILANWNPLVPDEEATVELETNGSLFDEEHWKQIENIGRFNVRVAITVMSFDEKAYQTLSGTKLPISKIESNLRFVKGLREKGIINYLEIATVVQERNFRYLPDFVRKCIEEYQPDYIRLRPYMPWGSREPEYEWFSDVRNPLHPYNQEYLDVMKDSIFQHPTVHDWSGGLPSNTGDFPYKRKGKEMGIVTKLLLENTWQKKLEKVVNGNSFAIYGLGDLGKIFVQTIEKTVQGNFYLIDRALHGCNLYGKNVYSLESVDFDKGVSVIVTVINQYEKICDDLRSNGFNGDIIKISALF